MEISEIVSDLGRAKHDLTYLQFDADIPPQRLERCTSAVRDLETVVSEIFRTAWIPGTLPELTASIACVQGNLRRLQFGIDDCIYDVIDRGQPDEFLRVSTAMSMGRLLEHQLDLLMDALMHAMPKAEWTN